MKTVSIRFYEELNDFLPEENRKVRFEHKFSGQPSVKDMIESLGVPHTEVDMILANGKSVDFTYIVKDKDDISVYPVFESFDIKDVQHLRPEPLRNPKFVLDVHLGTLARYLRMTGFDSAYRNDLDDDEIVRISLKERRTILTRDKGILKRSEVTHGYYVRNTEPEKQLKEVINRFHLQNKIEEFTRCMECNIPLEKVDKEKIIDCIPPKVKARHDEYFICPNCNRIYWKGTHYEKMKNLIDSL